MVQLSRRIAHFFGHVPSLGNHVVLLLYDSHKTLLVGISLLDNSPISVIESWNCVCFGASTFASWLSFWKSKQICSLFNIQTHHLYRYSRQAFPPAYRTTGRRNEHWCCIDDYSRQSGACQWCLGIAWKSPWHRPVLNIWSEDPWIKHKAMVLVRST